MTPARVHAESGCGRLPRGPRRRRPPLDMPLLGAVPAGARRSPAPACRLHRHRCRAWLEWRRVDLSWHRRRSPAGLDARGVLDRGSSSRGSSASSGRPRCSRPRLEERTYRFVPNQAGVPDGAPPFQGLVSLSSASRCRSFTSIEPPWRGPLVPGPVARSVQRVRLLCGGAGRRSSSFLISHAELVMYVQTLVLCRFAFPSPEAVRRALRSHRLTGQLAMVATAIAAAPSSRPTKPMRSPVVAFTLTRSGASPTPRRAGRASPRDAERASAARDDGGVHVDHA